MIFLTIGLVGFLISIGLFAIPRGKPMGTFGKFCVKVAPICWGAYFIWEAIALGSGWNIRVDLLVIYPILLALTLGALIFATLGLFRKS